MESEQSHAQIRSIVLLLDAWQEFLEEEHKDPLGDLYLHFEICP